MMAPWTTVGISTPARLAPQTMIVTMAAASAAAVTFGEICNVFPLEQIGDNSTNDTRHRGDTRNIRQRRAPRHHALILPRILLGTMNLQRSQPTVQVCAVLHDLDAEGFHRPIQSLDFSIRHDRSVMDFVARFTCWQLAM